MKIYEQNNSKFFLKKLDFKGFWNFQNSNKMNNIWVSDCNIYFLYGRIFFYEYIFVNFMKQIM